ncbi:hypothetical protein KAR91_30905 [Candidatus Pacearchaeota archaeon]|nr:hypothetical protein [Candidatus Pacearchaeota archaeon]
MTEKRQKRSTVERIYDKLDDLASDVSDIKVDIAKMPLGRHHDRIRRLEIVVYSGVALVLIGFMASLSNAVKPTNASQIENPIKIEGKLNP